MRSIYRRMSMSIPLHQNICSNRGSICGSPLHQIRSHDRDRYVEYIVSDQTLNPLHLRGLISYSESVEYSHGGLSDMTPPSTMTQVLCESSGYDLFEIYIRHSYLDHNMDSLWEITHEISGRDIWTHEGREVSLFTLQNSYSYSYPHILPETHRLYDLLPSDLLD